MEQLCQLYKQTFGTYPETVTPIAGAGSDRQYFRLGGVETVIGTIGMNRRENEAFIYLSDYFISHGLPVPKVIACSDDKSHYLHTDGGNRSLYDLISKPESENENLELLLHQIMAQLPRFHFVDKSRLDTARLFPRPAMDVRAAMWDLNYFKYSFLKPSGLDFDENRLEDDMQRFALAATRNPDNTLILRDFQSRNVMIGSDMQPCVIDFQGARLADGLYDVASFVWQARASFPSSLRQRLVETYRRAAEEINGEPIADFDARLNLMILFRTLQVLGAYGFRGYVERKAPFMVSIPQAVKNLREILPQVDLSSMPYLRHTLTALTALPQFTPEEEDMGRLTVTVMSFSYKKGIPLDTSGNGGGFVFDCRAMHNPGRYDEYKQLTGMDSPVIDFLEQQGEIQQFMGNCYGLVDPAVECYVRRGFSHLMVCFGCTGGRHRSVYGAEHLAAHIAEKYGEAVTVQLIHREQKIEKRL